MKAARGIAAVAWVAGVALGGASACAAFDGDDGAAEPGPDAGAGSADAGAAEAGGGVTPTPPGDAGEVGDAGPTPAAPLFATGFDEAAPFEPWARKGSSGIALDLAEGEGVRGRALLARIPAGTSGGNKFLARTLNAPAGVRTLRAAVSLRLSNPPSADVEVLTMAWGSADGSFAVEVQAHLDGAGSIALATLGRGPFAAATAAGATPAQLTPGTYERIELTATRATNTESMEVALALGSNQVARFTIAPVPASFAGAELQLGAPYHANQTRDASLYFDDVEVRAEGP